MESFDNLIISLLDTNVRTADFKKELAQQLDIDVDVITDVALSNKVVDGVVLQKLKVAIGAPIKKEKLDNLEYLEIEPASITFDVGDRYI